MALIHELKPLDRQVMLLYLEGLDGAEIGEVTGLSTANVATKIHRIKKILAARFHQGEVQWRLSIRTEMSRLCGNGRSRGQGDGPAPSSA